MLVIAGEPSGDRVAASVARALSSRGVASFGAGGAACARAGVAPLIDSTGAAVMGIADVARRAPALAEMALRLAASVLREPPSAALLVNFTELNARLGPLLRARGVPVLWCVAPQVWAWRAGRLGTLRGAFDRLAVILPFEEALWRDAGHDARYVGHPSLDAPRLSRSELRASLGLGPGGRALAVIAGSRPAEIARLAPQLCEAARRLLDDGTVARAAVLRAPWLDPISSARLQELAGAAGLTVVDGDPEHGAAPLLGAFDLSLAASGTASLEAALAGALPVVVYRLDRVAYAVARRLVRAPHLALANVLLGRRAVPELVQDEVSTARIVQAARGLAARVADGEGARIAGELGAILAPPSERPFGERVAAMLEGWIPGLRSQDAQN